MRRIMGLILIILLVFIMTGCDISTFEISENISAPKNMNLPITGEWIIEDYKLSPISSMDEDDIKGYIGDRVIFHEKLVSVGKNYFLNPSFKVKNVDAEDYLIYHYKTSPEALNIQSEKIQIVSISDKEQFFNDFIKVSDDLLIVNIDGVFFYLTKESQMVQKDNVDLSSLPHEIAIVEDSSMSKEDINTGILLGLKSFELNGEGNVDTWNYRTIYIRSYNKNVVSVKETDGLLLPRRSGFWKIQVERENKDGKINDNIVAYQLDKKPTVQTEEEVNSLAYNGKEDKQEQNTIKNVLFVSNDYISIENIHYRNKGQRYLEFYPIDNIGKGTPIKISDIMGEAGKEALIRGFNKEMAKDESYKNLTLDISPKENSFGMFRRNGMWIFKGRVNYMENGNYLYKDFNIDILPIKELISYDELLIPWKVIKAKVPEALDAFTSPNEDIAVVLTYGNLLIFRINNGSISDKPIERIKLNSGEKVVMAEWALGKYSLLWEEQF